MVSGGRLAYDPYTVLQPLGPDYKQLIDHYKKSQAAVKLSSSKTSKQTGAAAFFAVS